jgi:hypothetical protein
MSAELPIVEIRAINHVWVEQDPNVPWSTIERSVWRLEVRRAGETEWTEIPVINRVGAPNDGSRARQSMAR